MLETLKSWLKERVSDEDTPKAPELRQSGIHRSRPRVPPPSVPRRGPENVDFDSTVTGKVEDAGPGKNVLVRNKYIREETGTHETLKIVNDSLSLDDSDDGFSDDPYNTGGFDRAKNWGNRFRK